MTTSSYKLTDANQRYFGEAATLREAERSARLAARQFGGCFVVIRGDMIVALARRDGDKIRVERVEV